MAKKLYVGNLSFDATQSQIRDLFAEIGEVTQVDIAIDRYTSNPKGFGFVYMATEEAAQEAIKRLNGYSFDNRLLKVSEARSLDHLKNGKLSSN